MTIAFWLTTNKVFDPEKIRETTFGGCEVDAIYTARELTRLGHDVAVIANVSKRAEVNGHAMFLHYEDLKDILKEGLDTLVVVRSYAPVLNPRHAVKYCGNGKPKKLILWSGDSYDQKNNEVLHDHITVKRIDRIIVKSQWQKDTWLKYFPLLQSDKIEILGRSLPLEHLPAMRSKVKEAKFIYGSVAFRGVHKFLSIWPAIKEQIPQATLDIYCKTNLYIDNNPIEASMQELYAQLEKLPGLKIFDPLPNRDFVNNLANYYAMLYPNTFEETVCGVALESMACGVPVITSNLAALPVTIGDGGGILINHPSESASYDLNFVKETVALWNDKERREELSRRGFTNIREKYSILENARTWNNLLSRLHDSERNGHLAGEDGKRRQRGSLDTSDTQIAGAQLSAA